MRESDKRELSLATELVYFYDDFVEFNDDCSFLCDALIHLLTEESECEEPTLMGAKRHCNDLKREAEELKNLLGQLRERSYTEASLVPLKPIT